jgi:hypothetical protein
MSAWIEIISFNKKITVHGRYQYELWWLAVKVCACGG